MAHTPAKSTEHQLLNRVLRAANTVFCRVYHQLDVLSPCRLPARGPAILICNHTSGLDPLLIQSVCPRMIVWMMAREYYEIGALKKVYESIDAIPVARSGRDSAATRAALRALQGGRVLGVFPEGKIEKTNELLPFQPGIALLAAKGEAPIFPSYLDGSQRNLPMVSALTRSQRAGIAFGPSIAPPSDPKPDLENETERYRQAVDELRLFYRQSNHRRRTPISTTDTAD